MVDAPFKIRIAHADLLGLAQVTPNARDQIDRLADSGWVSVLALIRLFDAASLSQELRGELEEQLESLRAFEGLEPIEEPNELHSHLSYALGVVQKLRGTQHRDERLATYADIAAALKPEHRNRLNLENLLTAAAMCRLEALALEEDWVKRPNERLVTKGAPQQVSRSRDQDFGGSVELLPHPSREAPFVSHWVGDVAVLELVKGRMMIAGGVPLREAVDALVSSGTRKILLDLGNLPYIDSGGLGEIVRCYSTVSRTGGKLKLLNLTKQIHNLALLTIFESYRSEQEAIESF